MPAFRTEPGGGLGMPFARLWARRGELLWLIAAGLRYAFARVLLLGVVMVINPFGAVTGSDERSRDIWERVNAETYYADRVRERGDESASPEGTPVDPHGYASTVALLLNTEDWQNLAPNRVPDALDIYDLVNQVAHVAVPDDAPADAKRRPRAIFLDMGLGYFAPQDVTAEELTQWDPAYVERCRKGRGEGISPFRCMVLQLGEMTRYRSWRANPDCDRNTTARLMCIRAAGGLPLLFADTRSRDSTVTPQAEQGFRAIERIGVLVPVDYENPAEYRLVAREAKGSGDNAPYRLYPAAALYAVYCGIGRGDPAGPCPEKPPFVQPSTDPNAATWRRHYWGWSPAFQKDGAIVWGVTGQSRFADEFVSVSGEPLDAHCRVAGDMGSSLAEFGRQMVSGLNIDRGTACVYPRSLSYRQLGLITRKAAGMAFADTLVIVGDATAEADDFVETATHGRVNGALWHAMALDNLVSFGTDYPKAPRKLWGLSLTDHDLANLVAAGLILLPGGCLVVWARLRNRKLKPGILPNAGEWARRAAALALALGLMCATIMLMTGQLSAIPRQYNYAALSIVVLLQLASIAAVILHPLWLWMIVRSSVLAFISGELPPVPKRKRKSESKSQPGGEDDAVADAVVVPRAAGRGARGRRKDTDIANRDP